MENIKQKYNSTIISQMFWQLFPVQFLSTAISCLSSIINGFIIGNFLDSASLVALGFVSPMNAIIAAIASIISSGAKIISGRYIGGNENDKLKNVFSSSLISLFSVGVIFTIICLLFPNVIAMLLGADKASIASTTLYIRGLAFGIIPTFVIPCLIIFLQMINNQSQSFISVAILAVSNLVLSLINVTVIKGGVFGMGLSSSLSQTISMIYLFICVFKQKDVFVYKNKYIDKNCIKEMIVVGSPAAVANMLYPLRNIIFNTEALKIAGTSAVSCLAIVFSTAGIFDAVNIAVGAVVLSLASIFVGERDDESLRELFKVSIKIGCFLAFIKMAIIGLFGKPIVVAFGATGDIVAMAYELYVIYSFAMPINMVTLAIMSQLQSLGRIAYANVIYLLNAMICPLACCFLLRNLIGIRSIWISYAVAEVVTLLTFVIISTIKHKHLPRSIDDILDYNLHYDNKINISVNNMEDVVKVAKRVEQFCLENNIDSSKSKKCGLCLEEIAGNVVEHGFTKSKKKNLSIDIFVACESDDVFLRIRDNAPNFDPRVKLGNNTDDPLKNVGIKMVNKIAKEMLHQNTFNMNILSIKL